MSKKAKLVVSDDLPEDVVLQILCRLPVKSLIRFTCVSKQWRSVIISNPQFAMSTFQHASQTRTLSPRLLLTICPYYDRSRFAWEPSRFECLGDLDMPCFGEASSFRSLTLPQEVETGMVIASCNGLVLLGKPKGNESFTKFSLWNPSTRFFYKIASPDFLISSLSIGFGHVKATNEYKLVLFESHDSAIHIFSTRNSSWKHIRAPHSSFPGYEYRGKSHLFSNGACHWVKPGIRIGFPQEEEAIYAFDLAEEEFRQIPLPHDLLPNIGRLSTQVHIGGCLCVRSINTYGCSEFWVMKEYGIPESWVKLLQISIHDERDVLSFEWTLAFVTEGGSVVLNSEKGLVRIERRGEEKPFFSGRYKTEDAQKSFSRHVVLYDESLISV